MIWGLQMRRLSKLDIAVSVVTAVLCLMLALLQLNSYDISPFSNSILYLTPANERISNIWSMDPEKRSGSRQLTFSETGIQSFSLSPDGKWLVYAEYLGESDNTRLMLFNLLTSQSQTLTSCVDSSCEYPVFDPSSRYLAYERINLNSSFPTVAASSARIWLVDLASPDLYEAPLESDSQQLSMMALWSSDGNYLAVLDRRANGIRLYDRRTGGVSFILESYGTTGRFAFTADNTKLVFTALIERDGAATSLKAYNLADSSLETLQTSLIDFYPIAVSYSPNGAYLAALHGSEAAACASGPALYLARIMPSGTLQTISSTDYCVQDLVWDSSGERLLLQRLMTDSTGSIQAEIWLYTPDEATARQIIFNGRHPRWMP